MWAWSCVRRRARARARPASRPSSWRPSRRCALPGCGPRSTARRCPPPSGSRRTPPRCRPTWTVDGEEVGTGRIILLHDPAGNDAWDGDFRCVAYARAEIDVELITDPMLAAVGWSWLTDALDAHGAVLRHGLGDGDPRGDRELRGDGRGQRRRPAGDPRLVDAGARRRRRPTGPASTSHRTSRPGESCSARRSGCHRCPTAWPSSRAAGDSAARDPDERPTPPDDPTDGAPDLADEAPEEAPQQRPLLVLRDGLPPVTETEQGLAAACAAIARRHRPGGHRRRAGLGLPLLQPGLPDPAAPRGLRHLAGRPDRLRVPGAAGRGARGHRVDPARGHPGPAVPGRRRAAARTRCSTPSWPAGCWATRGSGWPRWSRPCSASG